MVASEQKAKAAERELEGMHRVSLSRYVVVWILLMVLTGLTFGVSRFDLGAWNAVAALVIAAAKATLVALFFMHLHESTGAIPIVLVTTLVLLTVLIAFAVADLKTRFLWSTPVPALEHGAVK